MLERIFLGKTRQILDPFGGSPMDSYGFLVVYLSLPIFAMASSAVQVFSLDFNFSKGPGVSSTELEVCSNGPVDRNLLPHVL